MGCNTSTQSKVSDIGAVAPKPETPSPVENIPKTPEVTEPSNEPKRDVPTPIVVVPQSIPPLTLQVPDRTSRSATPASQKSEDNGGFSSIRLLLLGSAESGKTTVLNQVRLNYKQNFTETEIFHRRTFIYHNVFKSIQALCKAMAYSSIKFSDPVNMGRAQSIISDTNSHYGIFSKDLVEKIQLLWKDPGMKKLYSLRSQFNLNDSTAYFLNNLEKINNLNYTPSERDLVMSYVPTCGVQNVIFTERNQSFQLFDIGGQKIDRRKWAVHYDGIDAIFFCLAISEYDQVMMEDMRTNRLDDALDLLSKISEEEKFATTPIYLFLNECDVFREKLSLIPLSKYKPEFQGEDYADDALDFMEELVCKSMGKRDPSLFRIYRCVAIDSKSMSDLLSTVFKDIIKRKK